MFSQKTLNRRSVLCGLTAASIAALIPRQSRSTPLQSIDVHHHVFPPGFIAAARARSVSPAVIEQWSLQRSLDEMDHNGIKTAIASITQPGVWYGNVAASRKLARECNEYMARLKSDYKGRFGFFAALALPDVEGSLQEIAYAFDTLRADGIGLMTSHGNRWAGDASFAPVFDELNRRKAVVYFHPTAADCCRELMPYVSPNLIEYPQDTARAIMSLLMSGTLARCRDIRFVFSHAGGTMPVLAGRVAQLIPAKDRAVLMPQGVSFELQRLYYEMANSANPSAYSALRSLVPVSQIMLGSDYPYVPIGVTATGLDSLGISHQDLTAIRNGNAQRLLGLAKS
jgi:6-methylsalicylate decarboxylase